MIAQGGSRSAIRLARHSVDAAQESCAGKSRRAPSTFAAGPSSCNLHTYVATNSTSRVLLLTTATSRRTATRAPRCGPTTPRSPGPASFRNSLRSNALVMAGGDASDDRPCGPEHISPLRVRQRVAALMRGIARHVTMIIRMRDDAGQRSAARNSSLRYIFDRTIPCRQYAVVTVRPTALPYVPGHRRVDVLASVSATPRRGNQVARLSGGQARRVAPGASIRCSPLDTDAPRGFRPGTTRCPFGRPRRQCAGSHATPVVRNSSYRLRPTKPLSRLRFSSSL
jgi:hypothetical protein